jgi:hypothetical protein
VEAELFILNNLPMSLKTINGTPVSVTPKVKFLGYRYRVRPLTQSEITAATSSGRVTYVTATGVAR